MRGKKVKKLRKEYYKLTKEPLYNIKGQIVEGQSWRQFKKIWQKDLAIQDI